MKTASGFRMLSLGVVLGLTSAAWAGEANLTRFGPEVIERERGGATPATYTAEFKAIEGPAELVLQDFGIDAAQIRVNGVEVAIPNGFRGNGEIVVPLQLGVDNTIEVSEVSAPGKRSGQLGVRVTQFTRSDINVRGKMYFGLNTSDIWAQRNFYNTLGLIGEIFPAGPEQCRTFAQSLGFPDDYLIYVALTSFNGAPPWVDTVQFRGDSFRSVQCQQNRLRRRYALETRQVVSDRGGLVFVFVEMIVPTRPGATATRQHRYIGMQ